MDWIGPRSPPPLDETRSNRRRLRQSLLEHSAQHATRDQRFDLAGMHQGYSVQPGRLDSSSSGSETKPWGHVEHHRRPNGSFQQARPGGLVTDKEAARV